MARNSDTAEKALAIVQTATWLAGLVDPHPDVVEAINAAYSALQFLPETLARNQVCAKLYAAANCGSDYDCYNNVRGFVAVIQAEPFYRLECTPREATESTIDAALAAWRRPSGARSDGLPDKWTATAQLLQESGFGRVAPDTLRKAWERRES